MDARCRKDESGYQNALFVARENAEKKRIQFCKSHDRLSSWKDCCHEGGVTGIRYRPMIELLWGEQDGWSSRVGGNRSPNTQDFKRRFPGAFDKAAREDVGFKAIPALVKHSLFSQYCSSLLVGVPIFYPSRRRLVAQRFPLVSRSCKERDNHLWRLILRLYLRTGKKRTGVIGCEHGATKSHFEVLLPPAA